MSARDEYARMDYVDSFDAMADTIDAQRDVIARQHERIAELVALVDQLEMTRHADEARGKRRPKIVPIRGGP